MNYHLGDFGKVNPPQVNRLNSGEDFGVKKSNSIMFAIAIGIGLIATYLIIKDDEKSPKKKTAGNYLPDRGDAVKHYMDRIKILNKKLDDQTISNKEADELYQIVNSGSAGRLAAYELKLSPVEIKLNLEDFFKSQGS